MASNKVEELVDQALKHSNFKELEEFLLNETKDGLTLKCSKQFIFKLDKLINRELDQQNVKHASFVFTLLHKMGDTLIFSGREGISVLVSQGLVKKWFEKAKRLWVEAGPVRHDGLVNLAEDFFDAVLVVHESGKEGTYQVTESLLHSIGKLASDTQVNILIQKEAVRKLNIVLGKIPIELKKEKKILSSQEATSVMDDLARRIIKGGDYDLQVALMEALCRMTTYNQRRELADHWFSMEFIATAFRKIQDSEFETDCRNFLNLVNGMQGDGRSVYSFPCLEVFLDKHVLLMPVDENLQEFWIDFNLGSQSISFYFCLANDQQEGQWDTLCIAENEVHSYTVEEEKGVKVLQLVLTEPVCLTNIEGSRLSIHFSSSLDILEATRKVYGDTKNKKFIRKTTSSVVKTTVQIILDEGGSQVLFPESQCSSQPMEEQVLTSVRNSTHCQTVTSDERDPQHLCQQMKTPLRKKVSESCMYVSGSAGRKLGRSPFSCVLPVSMSSMKVKVKRALELVASTERQKAFNLKEPLVAKSSHSTPSVSEEKKSIKKQKACKQIDRKDQEVIKYKRHMPVKKVLEMVQTEQDPQEEPLDVSVVPDSQPAIKKEASKLLGPSTCGNKKRISVSTSLVQNEFLHQPMSELPQQPASAQCSSEKLSHKLLHAQLTQRLEQIVKDRDQQSPKGSESVKDPQKSTQAQAVTIVKSILNAQVLGTGTKMNKNTCTGKITDTMVKQISSHYKTTALNKTKSDAPVSRFLFNKSWCPVIKISTDLLKSCNQTKKPSNQNEDVYAFDVDEPEFSEKKKRKSQKESSSSLTLSSAKKCNPAKPAGCNVKKHLFSDTDTDCMTDVSWLKSANRRPKPKVADYTRQPVKHTLLPADVTFETPNAPLPSPKEKQKVPPKPKRKIQKKVVDEKNKQSNGDASRKPTGRPQRTTALSKSYKELSDSESVSETDEPPPTKKLIQQPRKPQKTSSFQTRTAYAEQSIKEKSQAMPKTGYTAVKDNQKILVDSKQLIRKKITSPVESAKEDKKVSKLASFWSSHSPAHRTKAAEKCTILSGSLFTPIHPLSKKLVVDQLEKPQKMQTAFVQATGEAGKIKNKKERPEKEKSRSVESASHLEKDGQLMEEKGFRDVLDTEHLNSKKNLAPSESRNGQSEFRSSKYTDFCLSPYSVEKMRSEEKTAPSARSPLSPLHPLCISPVAAVSPPMDLPNHLTGIKASSFYKTPGRWNNVKCSSLTSVIQKQSAIEDAELSPVSSAVHPLIASTGKGKHTSPLNSPDLEQDLRGFLNSSSQRVLQACFDKESVISLVTLSQSSHRSVNIDLISTELEKTPVSVQGSKAGRVESGPATGRKRQCSFNSTSLSDREDSDEEEGESKARPSELATRMKPRKLFKSNNKPGCKKKGSKQPIQEDSSSEEERVSGISVVEDVEMCSTVMSSCWESSVKADMDLAQPGVSTSQEMGYVCHKFSSELKRKFEMLKARRNLITGYKCAEQLNYWPELQNRSRRMDVFTKQSLKTCNQHATSISMKVHKYRCQRLETVKRVLMEEIKNLEQDDTALRNMEEELTTYWKKQALAFHTYQEKGTRRLNHLKSTIETNVCHSLEYDEQIFSSQMHLMKKDMKSVQDHLLKQMHEEELLNMRRGLQTLFLSDVSMF